MHYFGEDWRLENCSNCDNCLHPKEKIEAKDEACKVLKVVKRWKNVFQLIMR